MSDELVIRLRGAVLKAATLIGPANPAAVFELGEAAEALAARVESVRNATLEEAAKVAEKAELPDDYQWGRVPTQAFNFGKERAASAIRALAPSGEGE